MSDQPIQLSNLLASLAGSVSSLARVVHDSASESRSANEAAQRAERAVSGKEGNGLLSRLFGRRKSHFDVIEGRPAGSDNAHTLTEMLHGFFDRSLANPTVRATASAAPATPRASSSPVEELGLLNDLDVVGGNSTKATDKQGDTAFWRHARKRAQRRGQEQPAAQAKVSTQLLRKIQKIGDIGSINGNIGVIVKQFSGKIFYFDIDMQFVREQVTFSCSVQAQPFGFGDLCQHQK